MNVFSATKFSENSGVANGCRTAWTSKMSRDGVSAQSCPRRAALRRARNCASVGSMPSVAHSHWPSCGRSATLTNELIRTVTMSALPSCTFSTREVPSNAGAPVPSTSMNRKGCRSGQSPLATGSNLVRNTAFGPRPGNPLKAAPRAKTSGR